MTARAHSIPKSAIAAAKRSHISPIDFISWESFQKRYLSREDGFTYEWTNGKIEKTPSTMDISQFYIWVNLKRFFQKLTANTLNEGNLVTEPDIFLTTEKHRRPDIAYFTDTQLLNGKKSKIQIPAFVIEVISPSDNAIKVRKKVNEYLEGGVQVIWNVYPDDKTIDIYEISGKITSCRGNQMCSAEAAIPGFLISVDDILKVPEA